MGVVRNKKGVVMTGKELIDRLNRIYGNEDLPVEIEITTPDGWETCKVRNVKVDPMRLTIVLSD